MQGLVTWWMSDLEARPLWSVVRWTADLAVHSPLSTHSLPHTLSSPMLLLIVA
jgi:hypothetical protein